MGKGGREEAGEGEEGLSGGGKGGGRKGERSEEETRDNGRARVGRQRNDGVGERGEEGERGR